MGSDITFDRELLSKYAPVVRFSGGEKFLPMNVEDFVAGNTRLYCKSNSRARARRVRAWDAEPDPRKRLAMLAAIQDKDAYLRYLSPEPGTFAIRVCLTVEIILLLAIAIFSVFGLARLHPDLIHMDYADAVKMTALGLLLAAWPSLDADGKSHLGLLLCLFAIFFFGTAFTLGFAALALAQLTGFWVVYLVFNNLYYFMVKWHQTWGTVVLHAISLAAIGAANAVFGLIADGFARRSGWANATPYQIPVILAAPAILFYFLMLFSNALRKKSSPESIRQREIATAIILLVVLLLCGLLYWTELRLGWLDSTATRLAIVFLFGATTLWYLLDPIEVTRPGLLREDNSRPTVFGWDGRVLIIITLTLLGYLVVSWLVYRHVFTDINDYLFSVLLHLGVSALILLVALGLLGDSIPGYLLDVMSGLYNIDALRAKKKYRQSVSRRARLTETGGPCRYWYYGRVVREREWVILQYNYFYAFNDFRSTAGGMNNHEGDWECVHVILRGDAQASMDLDAARPNLNPFGVTCSQHYHGAFEFWEDVGKAKMPDGSDSNHPLVYAALGSHAHYSRPEIFPLSLQFSGATQRMVHRLEEFTQAFRTRSNLVEKHMREVERAFEYYSDKNKGSVIAQGALAEGGAREFAGGDGIRVGWGFDPSLNIYGHELKVILDPPPAVARRESNFDGKPSSKEDIFEDWAFEIIDDETDWVKFRGLWGRWSRMEGERGPQGPRWSGDKLRIRWGGQTPGYYLEWLDTLLFDIIQDDARPTKQRERALRFMSALRLKGSAE
ncbi:MAG: hypothetical protein HFACDABA_00177 [Anaerolineales bacterium]|nr:hypothetical protein [Anaerolineales bacterium]